MRAQGFRSCVLEVLSSNARAIRFYEAHGFEKICSFMVDVFNALLDPRVRLGEG